MQLQEHEVFEAAFDLSYESRKELAERLLETLEEKDRSDVERAWKDEARRRLEAYRRGEAKARPVEDVFASMRSEAPQ